MMSSSTKIDERNNAMGGKGAFHIHLRFVSPPPGDCHRDDWRSTSPHNTWTMATHRPPADCGFRVEAGSFLPSFIPGVVRAGGEIICQPPPGRARIDSSMSATSEATESN